MMARSHAFIGMSAVTSLAAVGVWSFSPELVVAAFLGSLAPDIDHPESTLGRKLWFLSYSINRAMGHRTGTHSFLGLLLCAVAVVFAERAGYANWGFGFFVGFAAHIAADLITREGCALLYPWSRARFAFWPGVRTGGAGEAMLLIPIIGVILGSAYYRDPQFFDVVDRLRGYLSMMMLRV